MNAYPLRMNPGTQIDDCSHIIVTAHIPARLNLPVERFHRLLEFFLEDPQFFFDLT